MRFQVPFQESNCAYGYSVCEIKVVDVAVFRNLDVYFAHSKQGVRRQAVWILKVVEGGNFHRLIVLNRRRKPRRTPEYTVNVTKIAIT